MKMNRTISFFAACGLLLAMAACGGGSSTPPPPPPVLVVSPSSASVKLSGSQTFTVTNATGAVTWSINPPVGTINSSNGVYIAPSTFPSPSSVTVTASLGGQTGTATAQVVYPNNNSVAQAGAIKLGTSGGDVLDESATACCIGTLGSLIKDSSGNFFILSNNHVLGKSDAGTIGVGDLINQPGPKECFTPSNNVGTTVARAALKPTANSTTGTCANSGAPLCGPAPSNVDAAIAAIVPGTVDTSGSILDLGAAGPTSIGDAAPSSTLATGVVAGTAVAKSGRTTGLTCSTVQSTNTTVIVDYDASCGGATAFAAFFINQVIVNGGNFSAGGDSGSLIVTTDNARPVALLYAGNTTSTAGNPIADALAAFPTSATGATIVGGADHAVSCAPTSSAQSTQVGAQSTQVSARQRQAAINARDRNSDALMSANPAIRSIEAGASTDSPGEAALVIEVSGTPRTAIPAVIDGVRTKVVYGQGVTAPSMTVQDVNRTAVIKQAHEASIMAERGIQGIGVGRSDDSPGETAIVIYTIQGEPHPAIPAVIDGVRTKIVEGERFRAFGWNSQLEPKATACAKPKARIASVTKKMKKK